MTVGADSSLFARCAEHEICWNQWGGVEWGGDACVAHSGIAIQPPICGRTNTCGSGTRIQADFPYRAHDRKESSCILSKPGSLVHPYVCCCLEYTCFSSCSWQAAAPLLPAQTLKTVRQLPAILETRLRPQLIRQPAIHPRQLPRQHRAEQLQRRPRTPHLSRSR